MTEEVLNQALAQLRAGDTAAFEAIYRKLSPSLYTALYRVTGNRSEAEDLLQETFLRLYRSPPGPEVRHPRAWLFRVGRNLALDHLRSRQESLPLEEGLLPAPARNSDQRLDIESALSRLSPDQRLLVTLHLNSGLKFRELAQIWALPLGTVLRRYYAALDRLRTELNQWREL